MCNKLHFLNGHYLNQWWVVTYHLWGLWTKGNFPQTVLGITYYKVGKNYMHWWSAWWRHQMETFSTLLAICAGNSPVPGEFHAQRPVTGSFNVFFDLRLNKWLSKQSWYWWFEMLSRPLWRHCNGLTNRSKTFEFTNCIIDCCGQQSGGTLTIQEKDMEWDYKALFINFSIKDISDFTWLPLRSFEWCSYLTCHHSSGVVTIVEYECDIQ